MRACACVAGATLSHAQLQIAHFSSVDPEYGAAIADKVATMLRRAKL